FPVGKKWHAAGNLEANLYSRRQSQGSDTPMTMSLQPIEEYFSQEKKETSALYWDSRAGNEALAKCVEHEYSFQFNSKQYQPSEKLHFPGGPVLFLPCNDTHSKMFQPILRYVDNYVILLADLREGENAVETLKALKLDFMVGGKE